MKENNSILDLVKHYKANGAASAKAVSANDSLQDIIKRSRAVSAQSASAADVSSTAGGKLTPKSLIDDYGYKHLTLEETGLWLFNIACLTGSICGKEVIDLINDNWEDYVSDPARFFTRLNDRVMDSCFGDEWSRFYRLISHPLQYYQRNGRRVMLTPHHLDELRSRLRAEDGLEWQWIDNIGLGGNRGSGGAVNLAGLF